MASLTAGNKQLFDELSKEYPNCGLIRGLLNSGQADINALTMGRNDHLTAYWYIESGLAKHKYNWNLCHSFWGTVDTEEKLRAFKAHFYPLLDILEDYTFNIMNGASFRLRADGSKHLYKSAGFRFLDLTEFSIMAKHDVPRLVQFFERLYFSKGYDVDDTSTIGSMSYLSPLLWSGDASYNPEVILYFIMKGARWNQPAWRQPGYEERITNFAAQVPAAAAATMIAMLQNILGVNYATGHLGANLRGFLAAAYGTVGAVGILQKVVGVAARVRRRHTLTVAPKWPTF
jgi:hypothetical protein